MFNVKLCLIHSFFVECGCSHQHCSGLAWEEPIYLCPCIIVVGFYSHIIFFSFGWGGGGVPLLFCFCFGDGNSYTCFTIYCFWFNFCCCCCFFSQYNYNVLDVFFFSWCVSPHSQNARTIHVSESEYLLCCSVIGAATMGAWDVQFSV